jgi:hypothetical protein
MMVNFLEPDLIGWTAIASGVIWLIQYVFLGLMFAVTVSPYGTLSDISYLLGAILMLPFMLAFYDLLRPDQPTATLLALLVGMAGVLLITVAQIRLMIGQISLEQNMPTVTLGTGLIGISVLITILLSRSNPQMPTGFLWLGIVVGVSLGVVGILAGVLLPKDIYLMMTGGLDWSNLNPFMYVIFVAAPISQLGYPVWAIWLGRLILNNHILPTA